ncbi:Intermediate filament protein ifa 1 [Trichuris trichiura]|uniref:Intermediate filament protein ifa 1 n=1 Tax=Trichuris trichiura TaxID=36087 RepID=A0A077Z6U0_TRITR|nr:intermediate filament protein ifa-1 family protein [Trichuris suis]CDW54395.1 Intermediate filament protein ifa 1 [Trichuris trichiura]
MPEVKTTSKSEKTSISTEGGHTVKTTVKSEEHRSDSYGLSNMDSGEYRSTISARPGFSRTSPSATLASPGGGRVLKIVTEMGSTSFSGMSPSFHQAGAASAILESREREKKEMQDLNDRLASYIEKVRFLEAQNRKLANDLEALRSRWGKDTSSVKQMYEGELAEARKLIDDTAKSKAGLESQISRLQTELADFRKKYEEAVRQREGDRESIDGLLTQLSEFEAEANLLRRRLQGLEDEAARLKKENVRLQSELQKARTDLDQETLNRIDYQNQVQTLLEEIDFIRRVHDQEIKELQALAARDTTAENREFFKNELALAIRDIRNEYDAISVQNKSDMDSWYKLKVQEIQTASARQTMETGYQKEEVRRLRTQMGDLRGKLADLESRNSLLEKQVQELTYQLEDDQRQYESALNDRDAQIRKMREECQALMVELQMLLDTKQTLDAEIAIYRKMLEGEENRTGLRQLVEQVVKTHSLQQQEDTESMRVVKGEMATRTSFQRSAKGNVSIGECSPEGKFIILENTHRSKDESLDEWKLKRKIDGKREIVFSFPPKFTLKAGKSVKVWAKNQGGVNDPPSQLVCDEDTWGVGQNIQTVLYTKDGEEKATHIQRSSQQTSTTA